MSTALAETSAALPRSARPTFVRRVWVSISTAMAAVLGLLPHVLHHVGPLAGAALFAGVTGSLVFGAVGFIAVVPFLRRVRRRSGNWRVPAGILAAMVVAFSLSTFVVGPAITGADDDNGNTPSNPVPGHEEHH